MLFVSNSLLVINIYRHSKNSMAAEGSTTDTANLNRVKSLTTTVMSITLLFIVMTSPTSLAAFYYNQLLDTYAGILVLNFLNSLCFTYHSLNICILLVTNKKFSSELLALMALICGAKRSQQFIVSTNDKNKSKSKLQNNNAVASIEAVAE